MSSQLDKSLDEITAERRKTGPNRPRRSGRGGGGGAGVGTGARQEIRRSAGGVQKRRIDSYSPASRGSSNDTWTHDLFDRDDDKTSRLANNPLAARTMTQARLKVENLHYELSEEDLTNLFSKIGPVQSLRLKYDKMGRSDGVAFVTYTSLDDANEAIRRYDGANAAGQPITVTLDTETPRRAVGSGNRSRGRGFTRGPSRMASGPRMGGGRADRRPQPTQEDLDKELDDFMSAPPPGKNGNGEEMEVD